MGAVGDLDSYLRYKSALALGDAAKSHGGAGGALDAAAGLGLGLFCYAQRPRRHSAHNTCSGFGTGVGHLHGVLTLRTGRLPLLSSLRHQPRTERLLQLRQAGARRGEVLS